MSVNVLKCSLSPWTGDPERCRWCNERGCSRFRRFCSRECVTTYADNHMYARGRLIVLDATRAPCQCGVGIRIEGLTLPHRHCTSCGRCEGQLLEVGDKLTVDHVDPRWGIPMGQPNCIHHLANLRPLCWSEHALKNRRMNGER